MIDKKKDSCDLQRWKMDVLSLLVIFAVAEDLGKNSIFVHTLKTFVTITKHFVIVVTIAPTSAQWISNYVS